MSLSKSKERIQARKLATPHTCGKKDSDFAKEAVERVKSAVERAKSLGKSGTTTLVVVNRVSTARDIRDLLGKTKELKDARAILLTGRCRALERDRLLKQWEHRMMAGRRRDKVISVPSPARPH